MQWTQLETKGITIRYMETFFKENKQKWSNTGTGCQEKLWNLLHWKKEKFTWERAWATWSNCNCFVQRLGLDKLQRTLTNWADLCLWVEDSPVTCSTEIIWGQCEMQLAVQRSFKVRQLSLPDRGHLRSTSEPIIYARSHVGSITTLIYCLAGHLKFNLNPMNFTGVIRGLL